MSIDNALAPQLRTLGFDSYWAYVQSPHWRSLVRRYEQSDQPQSCICGAVDSLQHHHKTYERLGAERLDDLVVLCRRCHQDVHYYVRRGWVALDLSDLVDGKRASEYAAARRPVVTVAEQHDVAPLVDRLRRVRIEARHRHIDISSELRVIEQRIRKGERKVLRSAAQS